MKSRYIKFATMLAAGLAATAGAAAGQLDVREFRYAGPFAVTGPVMVDSVDVNSKPFDPKSALSMPLSIDLAETGRNFNAEALPATDGHALHLLNFKAENDHWMTATINVAGDSHEIYLDGSKTDGRDVTLRPTTHNITIKYLSDGSGSDTIRVSIEGDKTDGLRLTTSDGGRLLTLLDIMTGDRYGSAVLSPSGKYLLTSKTYTDNDGATSTTWTVTETSTGRQTAEFGERVAWMPKSDRLYRTHRVNGSNRLETVGPNGADAAILAKAVPSAWVTVAPTEDYLIYTEYQDEPKEKNKDLYEIVNPEDRQPGWRLRGSLMKFDLATGMTTRLTFGNRDVGLSGISDDGQRILYQVFETRLGARPTALSSLYLLDLTDMSVRPIYEKDGFVGAATLSPDGRKVLLTASPEALGGAGRNLAEELTPSMYDYQLIIVDTETGTVSPLTREFDPSVNGVEWSRFDGKIYFTAKNRDYVSLYRVDPATGRIDDLKAAEEFVAGFSLARTSPAMVYYGQGATNSDRLHSLDTRTLRHKLVEDLSAGRLDGIRLGECHTYRYMTSRGDSIYGRYILPPDFDPAKKYPMIVNYYGGCNPTSRDFDGRYPHHLYAAQGYVVLVIVPSGSTGFGQEFSSRHVNTAGEGVADDIIEGVTQFAEANPWIDPEKIGCIGASYGGFMTQYLQTKTDLFAAAISHAGISDHTSYWGEGYWGYSYSEVAMANSYPWSDRELYVDHSPLYNADKIHTPILFLHGDGDTNVPIGESIQMYTALKLLGRETAFVAVRGANHQVVEFDKRQQWQETIFAWFARWLRDDPSWWESLYPAKTLN
ncbi:MAG: prolyl oligopeptidase family serine peptidase [Clostridium sp.]|nr:prolyl oligopeptidase family serine peptidase [Clostridium sp.]